MAYSPELRSAIVEYHAAKKKEIEQATGLGAISPATSQKLDAELFAAELLLSYLQQDKPVRPGFLLLTPEQQQLLRKKTTKVIVKTDPIPVTSLSLTQPNTAIRTATGPAATAVETKADSKTDTSSLNSGSPTPSLPYTDETAIFPGEDAVWVALHTGKLGKIYQQAIEEYRKIRIEQIFKTNVQLEQKETFRFIQDKDSLQIQLDLDFINNDPRVETIEAIVKKTQTKQEADDALYYTFNGHYHDSSNQLRREMTLRFKNHGKEFEPYPFDPDSVQQQNLIRVDFSASEIQRRIRAFERSKGVSRLAFLSSGPKRDAAKLPPIPKDPKDRAAWREQIRAIEAATQDAKSASEGVTPLEAEISKAVVAKTNAILALIANPSKVTRCLFAQFVPRQQRHKPFTVSYSEQSKRDAVSAQKISNLELDLTKLGNLIQSKTTTPLPNIPLFSQYEQQKVKQNSHAVAILLSCLETGRPVFETGLWLTKTELENFPKSENSQLSAADQIWNCLYQGKEFLSLAYKSAAKESRRAEKNFRIQHIFETSEVDATVSRNKDTNILQIITNDHSQVTVVEIMQELGYTNQYDITNGDSENIIISIYDDGALFEKHALYQACRLAVSGDLIYCGFSEAEVHARSQAIQKSQQVVAVDHAPGSPSDAKSEQSRSSAALNLPAHSTSSSATLNMGGSEPASMELLTSGRKNSKDGLPGRNSSWGAGFSCLPSVNQQSQGAAFVALSNVTEFGALNLSKEEIDELYRDTGVKYRSI